MRFAQRLQRALFAVVMTSLAARAVQAAPLLMISQDGKHFSILHLVSDHETAAHYYAFSDGSGHPSYGSGARMATAAFYWDLDHNRLSLMVTAGGRRGSGALDLTVANLPITTRLAISDDPGQFAYHRGSGTFAARVAYTNATSGVILGRLEGNRADLKLSLKPIGGLTSLQVADGDPTAGGLLRPLDMTKPLFVSIYPFGGRHHVNSLLENPVGLGPLFPHTVNAVHATPGDPGGDGNPGSPVPEPAGLAACGLLLASLARRPRRAATEASGAAS